MSTGLNLPTIQVARAVPEPCQTHGSSGACAQFWYPAGPAMNTELTPIFSDPNTEYTCFQSTTCSPQIDFTDSPCSPAVCATLNSSPNFLTTALVPQTGYYEIQFMLANNFWGCNFSYGNSACGIQIRQGIAHMIDKTAFTSNQPDIVTQSTPIDNPLPTTTAGGLLSPNPCTYDAQFPQSGTNCVVGSPGGSAYHINAAAGANGFQWLYAPGSADLNAAAQHFVNAGLATGFNPSTSVLTGISSAVASSPIGIFVRNDDPPRLSLGQSLAEEICYLFTGTYSAIPSCVSGATTYLTVTPGPSTAFPGFFTSTTAVNLNWWMYTAAYSYVPFFDDSLYFTYNSRFVSGIPADQPPSGTCSTQAVPTLSAANYMYQCNASYDSLSSQMEAAPCISALGDPIQGATSNFPTSPGMGLCPNTSQLSARSAGIQAEANFGAGVFTLPVFERSVQFGYRNNGWIRASNNADVGLPNFFTWLNAYNPTPSQAGTIQQGFSQTTKSVNPFIASTPNDLYIVKNVYDSLNAANPLSPTQLIFWMANSEQQFVNNNLPYSAPANTVTTYRVSLRNDVFFQDGRPVTIFDLVFSYLSMASSGAFLGSAASSITGITILNMHQFDINVNSASPFVMQNLGAIPVVPARYWTNAGSTAWDSAVSSLSSLGCGNVDPLSPFGVCFPAQYVLNPSPGSTPTVGVSCVFPATVFSCSLPTVFSASLMTINPSSLSATFDPIINHVFVGSGPWECGPITSTGSGNCSSTGSQNPPFGGSYTLTRFGNGFAPGSSTSGIYFRSAGDLALWIWAGITSTGPGIVAVSSVSHCFGQPVNPTGPCAHWQQGIGASATGIVGVNQVSIVDARFGLNWISPYDWTTNPPTGIGAFPPVLYEGSVTLNPCSISPGTGYDC
jgi:hypothetical protein